MESHRDETRPPIEPWRLWLGRCVFVPLAAVAGGLIYALYRVVVSGEIHAVSRGYRVSNSVYRFSEEPVWFLFFFVLAVALAGLVVFATVVLARRVFPR